MIVLFVIIVVLIGAVLFLRGEGDSYGKGNTFNNEKKRANVSDKNFFL